MTEIWAYSESEPVASEAATVASSLAAALDSKPVLVVIGKAGVSAPLPEGIVLEGEGLDPASPESVAAAIAKAAAGPAPKVIVVGSTRKGREVASRVAAKLGVGCVTDALRLSVDGGEVICERTAYSGRVVARLAASVPCVVAVKPGSHPPMTAKFDAASYPRVDVGPIKTSTRILQTNPKPKGSVDLKAAKIVVSAGRGVKRKEDLAILQGLADALGGALGCSRPLSSDLGWLPEEHHIGLTGVTVRPGLYIAIGISGQLQHVAGMKDSKIVVAINTDRGAPIFQASDYGIVGDLYRLVPALTKAASARASVRQ